MSASAAEFAVALLRLVVYPFTLVGSHMVLALFSFFIISWCFTFISCVFHDNYPKW